MLDETRSASIEAAIADIEAAGRSWTNQTIFGMIGGNYASLSAYLKSRRAGTLAVLAEAVSPAPVVPDAPLAAARRDWVDALRAVAAFAKRPRPRDRAADAAYQAQGVAVQRALSGAEARWRPVELAARNALATYLAWQAQCGRGNSAEQARCQEALQGAQSELVALVGGTTDPLATVQALLAPPVLDGKPILPPLT